MPETATVNRPPENRFLDIKVCCFLWHMGVWTCGHSRERGARLSPSVWTFKRERGEAQPECVALRQALHDKTMDVDTSIVREMAPIDEARLLDVLRWAFLWE